MIELFTRYGSAQPKEHVERFRPGKKESKKKGVENSEVKKYVLTVCRNGEQHEVTPEEFKTFVENNKEVSAYFSDINSIKNIKVPIPPTAIIYDHWDKAARKIISHLWKVGGITFRSPVDPITLQIPDYFNIIKKPMDLGTIKKKLTGYEYTKCKDFVDDVELVFNNTIQYNGESSDYGKLGKRMLSEFADQCKAFCLDYYM